MLAFVGSGAALEVMQPRIVPPGNVWTFGETLAIATILLGACVAGWRGLRWFESLVLACVGAAFFDVWLPDSRDCIGMGMGGPPFDWYVRNYALFILVTGVSCAGLTEAARAARKYTAHRARRNVGRCPTCRYDLRGLPEPRCPECGAFLDPDTVPPIQGQV